VLTYGAATLGLKRSDLLLAVIVSSVIGLFSLPFYGGACDRFGRKRTVLWGSFVLLVMSWPYFWALDTRSLPLIILATVVAVNVGNSAVYAPQPPTSPSCSSRMCATAARQSARRAPACSQAQPDRALHGRDGADHHRDRVRLPRPLRRLVAPQGRRDLSPGTELPVRRDCSGSCEV
jgi:hypothetical protein